MGSSSLAKGFFGRIRVPIGIEMVTVEDAARADLVGTFTRLAQIGYREVELPGLLGHEPKQIRSAADRAGLRITAVHVLAQPLRPGQSFTFRDDPNEVVRVVRALGAGDVIVPLMLLPEAFQLRVGDDVPAAFSQGVTTFGPTVWKATAEFLNRTGALLNRAGLRLGYHNHNFEMAPMDGAIAWDILAAHTDPKLVNFEVDVGWIAAGGHDPVNFIEKHAGRIRWLHLKDIAASTKPNFAMRLQPTEVGSGSIEWPRLLHAAFKAGVRHFYVEQEPPFTMSPLTSASKSYQYLSHIG